MEYFSLIIIIKYVYNILSKIFPCNHNIYFQNIIFQMLRGYKSIIIKHKIFFLIVLVSINIHISLLLFLRKINYFFGFFLYHDIMLNYIRKKKLGKHFARWVGYRGYLLVHRPRGGLGRVRSTILDINGGPINFFCG